MAESNPRWWQQVTIEENWYPRLGNVAQILSALIAMAGFIIISHQITHNAELAQQASARQTYLSYMNAGLQYYEFIKPDYDAIKKTGGAKYEQYKWFVSYFLSSYDEIFFAKIDGPEWRAAFNHDVRNHIAFLCDEGSPEFMSQFDMRTRALVSNAKRGIENCKYR